MVKRRCGTARTALVLFAMFAMGPLSVKAADRFITLASTTSTENSGLLDELLPAFEYESGIRVRVIAVGTGQAIRLGRNGDADLLLVHHRPSEERFVADGFGAVRHDVMHNDYVIVGPPEDPAGIAGLVSASAAFRLIAGSGAAFASRGDDSGTHRVEMLIWRRAGLDPTPASGHWYRELGSGMGATLNAAGAMAAYALSDRATWLYFANRSSLTLLVEGDPALFNQYGIVLVSQERHPHVKWRDSRAFADWLLSAAGQSAIARFRLRGMQVFFPNGSP